MTDLFNQEIATIVARLTMAVVAGGVIGWEREKRDKPAGLKTHMLVGLGAATFMIGAVELAEAATATARGAAAGTYDPMRALAGVIGGVGFLGAGTIIQSRGSVQGVTTAASIWVTAAIGVCCGMGVYRLAVICGIFVLLILLLVGFIERRWNPSEA